jgi:hypothetical protein
MEVSVYVPSDVDKIELVIVHSDNFYFSPVSRLHTYIEVIPDKPARESPPPPDVGDLNAPEHIKKLVWTRAKGVKGEWTFTFVPRSIAVPIPFREKVMVRYGGVITLTTEENRTIPLAIDVRRKIKGTLVY